MTKEDFEKLKSTVKQWLFHTGSLDPTNYANELKLKFIEPKEKRIEELIALINAERERQEKCDDIHLRTIADLEKENAELKEKVKPENCLKLLAKEGYIKFTNDQLTKAKEIIFTLLDNFAYPIEREDWTAEDVEIVDKAEQFLKEADECAKELEQIRNERNLFQEKCEDIELNYYCDKVDCQFLSRNDWRYPSKGELPKCDEETQLIFYVNCYYEIDGETLTGKRMVLGYYKKSFLRDDVKLFVEKSRGYEEEHLPKAVIAWKEIVLPELKE